MKVEEKIEETIESICNAVQKQTETSIEKGMIIDGYIETISALADLIKANAEYKTVDIQAKATLENYLSHSSKLNVLCRGGI